MHEGNNTEFDLQLRSMLADAEEKAPRRVWKGVERALGRGKAPWAKWGWAGLCLAAAASLALVLALPGGKAEEAAAPMIAEAQIPAVEIQQPQAEETAALVEEAPVRVAFRRAAAAAPATEAVEAETMSIAAPAEEEVAPQPAGREESASRAPKTSTPSAKTWKDPFAQPAPVYRKPAPKIAFGGSLASNDNVSSAFAPGGRYAAQGLLVVPNKGLTETDESSYAIPLSFGIDARFYLSDRISLGTGVQYTYLSRSFKGNYMGEKNLSVSHALHYVGIPLNLYADIVRNKSFDFYAFAGGAAEAAVKNIYNIQTAAGVESLTEKVEGLQWSVGAGVGLQFNLNDTFGIFVDPSVNYYFDCNQPRSVRTESPFVFNLKAGLRFNL